MLSLTDCPAALLIEECLPIEECRSFTTTEECRSSRSAEECRSFTDPQ
jgi:hypothetical protein